MKDENSNITDDQKRHLEGYTTIGWKAVQVEKPIKEAGNITCYSKWLNKLAIYYCGGESEPMAVFITGVNKRGTLNGQYLNSTTKFFGSIKYCVEYTPRLMDRMMFAYWYRKSLLGVEKNKKRLISGKY